LVARFDSFLGIEQACGTVKPRNPRPLLCAPTAQCVEPAGVGLFDETKQHFAHQRKAKPSAAVLK
jgi:hypothetical protein